MSVYKEAYYAIHKIENKSSRIYPGACDYGAKTKKGDDIWTTIQQLVNDYGKKETRRQSNYSTGTSVQIDIPVMNEMDMSFDREVYRLHYVSVRGKREFDGYVYIERISVEKSTVYKTLDL